MRDPGAGRTASMMGSTISSADILCRRSKADGRAGSPTELEKTRARDDMRRARFVDQLDTTAPSVVGRSGPRLTFSLSFTPRISFLVLWTSSLRFLYCRIKFVDLAEIHGCRSVLAILLVGRGPGRRSWEVSQTLALVGAWFVGHSP